MGNMIFKKEDKKVDDWHKMKALKNPPDEIPVLENHKEILTINGSIALIEYEYEHEQTTIRRRRVPSKKPSIYVVTKVEKISNEIWRS
jgi:hypothetical protein